MSQKPEKIKIVTCLLKGQLCEVCLTHTEDGSLQCPKGHKKGKSYDRNTNKEYVTCHILQDNGVGTCSICGECFGRSVSCLNGHIPSKGYLI